jgi:2-polyprenyl-3-methyl-5-hydroxy-6-metoxy-1,4-benzoquinol methylase
VSTSAYTQFEWNTTGAGDGRSGEGLAQVFIDLVRQLKDVKSICDLGCGNGYITGRLALLGYDVTGVDASETGIEIARCDYTQATFIRSLIDKDLAEHTGLATFDLVISSDVIEHLYRPSDLFEAAVPLLKPQGQILVGTPYHGYLKNLTLAVTGKMDNHFNVLDDGGHIKFFSVKTLSELLTRYHFADLHFSFYGRARWLWKNMICHARRVSESV